MRLPDRLYKIRGLELPPELTSIGILGFCLQDGVQVNTTDSQLTTEQVRAIARFLINYPYNSNQQEIRKWAKNLFNPDEILTPEARQYVDTNRLDPKYIIDPFGLIRLSGSD